MKKQITKKSSPQGDLMETPAEGRSTGEQPKAQILHPLLLSAQEPSSRNALDAENIPQMLEISPQTVEKSPK